VVCREQRKTVQTAFPFYIWRYINHLLRPIPTYLQLPV